MKRLAFAAVLLYHIEVLSERTCPNYMITVDISNVWGQLTLADLLAIEQELSLIHI